MKPSEALRSHRHDIRRIVESHRARNARTFGSVLRGDDTEDSDLDVLVDPLPGATLLDMGAIQIELEEVLGGVGRCAYSRGPAGQDSRPGYRRGCFRVNPKQRRLRPADHLEHMLGMRNRMAHGYFEINLDIVWDTVQQSLPELEEQIVKIQAQIER